MFKNVVEVEEMGLRRSAFCTTRMEIENETTSSSLSALVKLFYVRMKTFMLCIQF